MLKERGHAEKLQNILATARKNFVKENSLCENCLRSHPGAVAQVPIAGDATNLTTRSCTRIRPKSKQHLVIHKSLNQRLHLISHAIHLVAKSL
ncbi:hypothetical protein JTE90_025734 [Oedothorax gibbosus]|uniref:Ferritin n=1 Tax=Oedothorax gibbosus TaxID=931172 RepID=A0AAV6UX87_9ARAC|nr:hypothetical protein JTE90_025734 [Oedothorax gibbosus]